MHVLLSFHASPDMHGFNILFRIQLAQSLELSLKGIISSRPCRMQEHAYYGSFGYHVTNPFAVSSRSGALPRSAGVGVPGRRQP